MIQIILDSNIYDRLEQDAESVELLQNLIRQEAVKVLMPRQVVAELRARPAGLPELFAIEFIGHAVARAGVMCAGDYLGSGKDFDKHKGTSNKAADASIVDVAAMVADWFVSEDGRSLRRFPDESRCIPMCYEDFREKLREFAKRGGHAD